MDLAIKRNGYDPFIDYLKGVSIIFVILTHLFSPELQEQSLFCLWGAMAVPLFMLIQVFHAYKKDSVVLKWKQMCKRIIVPFVMTQVIICMLLILLNGKIEISIFQNFGNYGPGAYYPYIYIQFAILLWLISPYVQKVKNTIVLLVIFIVVSQLLELLSIYLEIDTDVYRLLFFRYTFLIFLGLLLVRGKLKLTIWTGVLSLVSILSILAFEGYVGGGKFLSSAFYMDGWRIFHWICYFYVAYFLLFAMKWSFTHLSESNVVYRYLIDCGKYSYELFLFQMLFLTVSPVNIVCSKLLGTGWYVDFISIVLNLIVITIPVLTYKKWRDRNV